MSIPFAKEHLPSTFKLKWRRYPTHVINRPTHRESTSSSDKPSVSADDELALLTKAVVIMTIIALTPFVLMHTVFYFYPEIFMVPIIPN